MITLPNGDGIVWPCGKRIAVMLTFDFDAEYLRYSVIGREATGFADISRGQYGPHEGLERCLARSRQHSRCRRGAGSTALSAVFGAPVRVLLADAQRIPEKKLFLAHLGLDAERISGIAGIDFRGIDPWQQREQALSQLEVCGRRLMQDTGAQLLILGCLSFLGLAAPLSDRLGIPVIDPAIAAVSAAESLVRQKLATSRLAYPTLLSQQSSWSAGEIKL